MPDEIDFSTGIRGKFFPVALITASLGPQPHHAFAARRLRRGHEHLPLGFGVVAAHEFRYLDAARAPQHRRPRPSHQISA